uniref:Uncharacterized protein n=1 Tax=Cacopsylla melanoneura TaxID=428564 RepID=A0A8D8S0I0_9HEMI
MADPTSTNIAQTLLGTVHEISGIHGTKAVVLFDYEGKTQRAYLRCKNVVYDGISLPEDTHLERYVPVGTEIYFRAHTLIDIGPDLCKFFIIVAWKRDDIDFPKHPSVVVFHGMSTVPCYFSHHGDGGIGGYGVATPKDDPSQLIKFFYHKVFIKGERYKEGLIGFKSTKEMQCDAIPTAVDPIDGTTWIAKFLWRGKRPDNNERKDFVLQPNMLDNIKELTRNPRSIFMRTTGQIIKVLDKEYGVALAMIRLNEWHTVLFHATACYLNETSLAHINLRAVFKPGDKITLLAAKAPSLLPYQWVASNVSVYRDPSFSII